MMTTKDYIEFEDDAPLELTSDANVDEVETTSNKLDQIFEKEKQTKKIRDAKVKQKPEPLKLRKKMTKMKQNYKPKEYIAVECQICQREYTHAKKDENGSFEPYALCQHILFKGVFDES